MIKDDELKALAKRLGELREQKAELDKEAVEVQRKICEGFADSVKPDGYKTIHQAGLSVEIRTRLYVKADLSVIHAQFADLVPKLITVKEVINEKAVKELDQPTMARLAGAVTVSPASPYVKIKEDK